MKEFNNPPNVFSIKKFLDLDFITIADEIFKTENSNIDDNTSIELYDLYVGNSLYLDKPITYNLLLYKNSKIIHNLFPTENQFNKYPKGFQLYRKLVKSQCDYYNGYFEYEINYFDNEGKNLYKLIFTLNIQQFLTAKFISNIDNTNLQVDIPPIKMNIGMHMGAFLIPTLMNGNLGVYELFLKECHKNNFINS